MGVLTQEERPEIPEDCPAKYAKLMRDCWASRSEDRPDTEQIIKVRAPLMLCVLQALIARSTSSPWASMRRTGGEKPRLDVLSLSLSLSLYDPCQNSTWRMCTLCGTPLARPRPPCVLIFRHVFFVFRE
jgi:hypothetical protein